MNDFFTELGHRWTAAARRRGAEIEPPVLELPVAEQLLELARVVAHGKERRFAPLAAFMAGVAAERFHNAQGAGDAADLVREVREELERDSPPRERE